MPRKPATPAATTPPAAFDVDSWIDALPPRPTTTVPLAGDLVVTVRQLTDVEVVTAASASEVDDEEHRQLSVLAAACTSPVFTAEQLKRLRTRDRSGEAMVGQLYTAAATLRRIEPAPATEEA